MSCLLFLSWISDLMDAIDESGAGDSHGFADDLAVVPTSNGRLQELLDIIGNFMTEHQMYLGWGKTAAVLFRPEPDLASYPKKCEFTLKGMLDGKETRTDLRIVEKYE